MRHRGWQRALSASLALVVLLTSVASAYTLFRCHYDDVARRECCCPRSTPRVDAGAPAALLTPARGCCDVAHHEATRVASEPVRKQSGSDVHAIGLVSDNPEWPVPMLVARARSSNAEPIGRPPTLLSLKRSLLI